MVNKIYGDIEAFIEANYLAGQLEERLMSWPIFKKALGDSKDSYMINELVKCHEQVALISQKLEEYRISLLKE